MSERITNAAFYKHLADQAEKTGRSECLIYADELSMFLTKEDARAGLLTTLTRVYSCPRNLPSETIGRGSEKVKDCCVNTLVATTPSDLNEIIPSAATGKGFTPRLHMIYQTQRRHKKFKPHLDPILREKLVNDLRLIKCLVGTFKMSPDAEVWIEKWYDDMPEEAPVESIEGYYYRKHDAVLKLAMVINVSRGDSLVLEISDFARALNFLTMMEKSLPSAYAEVGRAPSTIHFDKIHRQVLKKGGVATRAQLLKENWSSVNVKELDDIMASLEAAKKIRIEAGGDDLKYIVREEDK